MTNKLIVLQNLFTMFPHLAFATIYVVGIVMPIKIPPLTEEKTQVPRDQWLVQGPLVSR